MGGIKRSSKFFKDDNGGEREEELFLLKEEEGVFIARGQIKPLGEKDKENGQKNWPEKWPSRLPGRPTGFGADEAGGPSGRTGPAAGQQQRAV